MFHESAMEMKSESPKLGAPASSRDVELFSGKDSGGHGPSAMASGNVLETLERNEVGESSLICEKGTMWMLVTRRGRLLLGELGTVDEGEATPVVMFSASSGMVRLWVDSGVHGDVKEYTLSSALRASSR